MTCYEGNLFPLTMFNGSFYNTEIGHSKQSILKSSVKNKKSFDILLNIKLKQPLSHKYLIRRKEKRRMAKG